jgi:hypothetical protein
MCLASWYDCSTQRHPVLKATEPKAEWEGIGVRNLVAKTTALVRNRNMVTQAVSMCLKSTILASSIKNHRHQCILIRVRARLWASALVNLHAQRTAPTVACASAETLSEQERDCFIRLAVRFSSGVVAADSTARYSVNFRFSKDHAVTDRCYFWSSFLNYDFAFRILIRAWLSIPDMF